ncbi:hypothetical protein [Brachybacterium sp. UMB0905]|uniref:hypothetical protein n=1 Tax=Brachybacterium sp. UMB0905 TaxID=2069310 RepID=UPI000C807F96|nr:hypothetical protein [Brachybacterium sp. UMB0905]PMC76398.1 hypothetical protein CJ197_04375 [Brachybacterium sp. UMB0905]
MAFEFKGAGFGTGGGFKISGDSPSPIDGVQYSDNAEVDSAAELHALESAYIQRRKAEDKRKRDATDSEYWFAVCFESRAEKEAFLHAIGAKKRLHGDKYLRGRDLARLLNIDMKE